MRELLGVVLVIALVAAVVATGVLRRRRRDEIRSVHHYHDRLDTLHVAPQDRGGSVRVVGDAALPEPHDAPDRPRLDPAAAHLEAWAPPPRSTERRHHHDQRWAMQRMEPRARIDTGTVLVVAVVVAVLVAIALAGYLIHRDHTVATTTSTTSTSSTTTTTVAATLTATSVTGGLAVYDVAPRTYVLSVTAVGGPEWMQLTVPPLSAGITTKTLPAGGVATTSVTGPSDLELGAPSGARVAIDHVPVVLPAHYTPPLTLRFEPPR